MSPNFFVLLIEKAREKQQKKKLRNNKDKRQCIILLVAYVCLFQSTWDETVMVIERRRGTTQSELLSQQIKPYTIRYKADVIADSQRAYFDGVSRLENKFGCERF